MDVGRSNLQTDRHRYLVNSPIKNKPCCTPAHCSNHTLFHHFSNNCQINGKIFKDFSFSNKIQPDQVKIKNNNLN